MKKKHTFITTMVVIVSLLLVACGNTASVSPKANKEKQSSTEHAQEKDLRERSEELKKENKELNEKIQNINHSNQQQGVINTSLDTLEAIKNKDFQELSNHIHPSKGARFSPYFFIDTVNGQVLTSQQVANLNQNNTVINWGDFDGTGEPINLNFNDYYDRFIYDHDYVDAHIVGIDTVIGSGNMMDNVTIEFPDATFIEYHFTGFDPQYDGMDWKSLRLVFEQNGGTWYLVGIVHGEWTI